MKGRRTGVQRQHTTTTLSFFTEGWRGTSVSRATQDWLCGMEALSLWLLQLLSPGSGQGCIRTSPKEQVLWESSPGPDCRSLQGGDPAPQLCHTPETPSISLLGLFWEVQEVKEHSALSVGASWGLTLALYLCLCICDMGWQY